MAAAGRQLRGSCSWIGEICSGWRSGWGLSDTKTCSQSTSPPMKRKYRPSPDVVPHPRYGSVSLPSGVRGISLETILSGYWGYKTEHVFPDSVLIANPDKQNYSIFPRQFYVDILKTCRSCARPFIFFAAQQKHWFETLGFFVDADCVHCSECRAQRTTTKRAVQHYSSLVQLAQPNSNELQQLVDATVWLLTQGALKNRSRLGHIKNLALRQISQYPGTLALAEALRNVDMSASDCTDS